MKHLFISDPLELMDSNEATKLFIAEAESRGHFVETCELKDLFLNERGVGFREQEVMDFDVVWIRKDPPVDRMYLEHLQLLAQVRGKVLFVNDPLSVMRYGDKLSSFNFSEFIPDTLVTADRIKMAEFVDEYGGAVVKPLNSFSGKGVYKIKSVDEIKEVDHYLILQDFLPNVVDGDIRIHLAFGEVIGALKRVPAKDSILGNIHAGGSPEFIELAPELESLANMVAKYLMREGIVFAGIDIIDGYLSEINVTSPGVIHETNEVSGQRLQKEIFDLLEKHV